MMRWIAVVTLAVGLGACTPNEPRVFEQELDAVPDVVGYPVPDARQELRELGFIVRVVEPEGTTEMECPDGRVLSQDPEAGDEVLDASTITLTATDC